MDLHSEHLHSRLPGRTKEGLDWSTEEWPTNRFFRLTLWSALSFRLQSCHQGKGFPLKFDIDYWLKER